MVRELGAEENLGYTPMDRSGRTDRYCSGNFETIKKDEFASFQGVREGVIASAFGRCVIL